MNDGPIGPCQRIALCSTGLRPRRASRLEPLDGVDRPEHLHQRAALRLQAEVDVVALALHPVDAGGEAVAVDLVAVQQARLHDALAAADLVEQAVDVGDEVVVDVGQVLGDHRAEQQPAEAGQRIDREHEVTERDTPGRRDRAGVPHLQLGQQHLA